MKSSLKYILLFVTACLCSFVIYYFVGPTDEHHNIGIFESNAQKNLGNS